MSIMGAFLLSAVVSAAPGVDTTPPDLTAAADGGLLMISANDDSSGVDAVFINGRRVNYRVDGEVVLPLAEYAGSDEWISVYAADFAGNISDTVKIQNPLYSTPALTPEPTPAPDTGGAVGADGSGQRPFTPAGEGSVVDNPTSSDGKEFFTIKTPEGNEFFLVIDRQRNEDGVYLLNSVTEQDLMALTKSSGTTAVSAIPTEPTLTAMPEPSPDPSPTPEPAPVNNGSGGSMIFIIIAVIAVGIAGYYFKIVRPKQQAPEDDGEDNEDEADDGDNEVYDDSDDYADDQAGDVEDSLIGLNFAPDDTFGTEE